MTVTTTIQPQQSLPQQTDAANQKLDQAKADNFLSLLNIGSISASNAPTGAAPHASQSPDRDNRPEDNRPSQPAASSRTYSSSDNTAPRAQPDSDASAHSSNPRTRDDRPDRLSQPGAQRKSAEKADSNSEDEDISARQKKIREQLADQLDNISQLLQALISAFSASQSTPSQTGSATEVIAAGNNTSNTSGILIPGAATDPTGIIPALPASPDGAIALPAGLTSVTPQEEAALLKEVQSLLQQLRSDLQAIDAAPAATDAPSQAISPSPSPIILQSEASPATSQTDATTAQKDIAQQLQQFIQSAKGETVTITLPTTSTDFPLLSASAAAPQATVPSSLLTAQPAGAGIAPTQSLLTAIKQGIAQIRQQLQTLQQDNESAYAQAKTSLQQQFEATQASFNPVAAVATTDASAPVLSSTAINPQATAAISIASAPSTPASAPASIIIALNTETSADNQTNDQSTGQNSQNQPSAPVPVNAPATTSRSEVPSFARNMTRAGNPQLAEQVTQQVKAALTDGTSRIRIQLDPADLGKIDIKLTVDADGKTGVSILVDNKNTLDLLQRDASTLARTLNDAGLSTDGSSLSFNLRGGQQQQQNSQQAATTYKRTQPEEEEPALLAVTTRNYSAASTDGLDIRI